MGNRDDWRNPLYPICRGWFRLSGVGYPLALADDLLLRVPAHWDRPHDGIGDVQFDDAGHVAQLRSAGGGARSAPSSEALLWGKGLGAAHSARDAGERRTGAEPIIFGRHGKFSSLKTCHGQAS